MSIFLVGFPVLLFALLSVYLWRPWRSLAWAVLLLTALPLLLATSALVLTVLELEVSAPLEEPASTARTPNPSESPWYFLGLQEVLVYADPWMATFGLPTLPLVLVVFAVALAAELRRLILDRSDDGHHRTARNPWLVTSSAAVAVGLLLISTLAFIAERGPDRNFFGPYDDWESREPPSGDDPAKRGRD